MKWNNVHRDPPPENGQEVLLSVNGVYYLTRYDTAKKVYRLKDDPRMSFSDSESVLMYWVAIEEPPSQGFRDEY